MGYCSIADVRNRVPKLDAVAAPDPLVQIHIDAATARVDTMLAPRHTVPFTTIPEVVKHITADLAAADVIRSAFSGGAEDKDPQLSAALEQRGMAMLEALTKGKAFIPGLAQKPMAENSIGIERQGPLWDWDPTKGNKWLSSSSNLPTWPT